MKRLKLKALDLERQLAQTQALQRIMAGISAELNLSLILNSVVEQVDEVFEANRVAVFLRQQEAERLTLVASKGLSTAYVAALDAKREPILGCGLDLRSPIFVRDATDSSITSHLSEEIRREGFRSMLVLPLIFAGDVLGVLALYHDHLRAYDEDEISLAFTFAHQIAVAIRNATSFEREKEQEEALALKNRQLAALLRTSNFLVERNDLNEQLRLIVSTVREVSGFGVIKVFVVDEESQTMQMVAAVGLDAEEGARLQRDTLAIREAIERAFREEHRISNSYLIPHDCLTEDLSKCAEACASDSLLRMEGKGHGHENDALIVPLYLRDKRLVGMISVDHPLDGKMLSVEAIQLLEIFAGQAAIAIRNSRLYSRLRAALKAKDEFLAVASHELKTPLTSIMAYTQHLLQKLPAIEENNLTRLHLEVVNAQSRRMTRLVQEVLDVSALEKGTLKLQKSVVDLGEIIQKSTSAAKAASASHRFVVERLTYPVRVFADEGRLGQAIDDLLANAVKYSPGGGSIRVTLDVEPTEAIVSISDEGVGIAKEHIPHIFERFYQVDGNPRTRQFGGMGLGLYLSKELIEAHGGRIWVESRKGEGSTFYFALPLYQDEPGEGPSTGRQEGHSR